MSKPTHRFVATAPAAQHCAELVRRGPDPADHARRWQALGQALAAALAARLAPILGGVRPAIAAGGDPAPPRLAAHGLIRRHAAREPINLVIDGAAVLRLIDLAFGGRGEVPTPLPPALPPSAGLVVEGITAALRGALAEVLGCALDEFAAGSDDGPGPATDRATIALTVSSTASPDWTILLSLSPAGLAEWLGPRRARPAPPRSADPVAAPFADVPLPLAARLVDMRVPLSTVARLEPGMVLPVAVARAVPLEAGGRVIARGTVGNQDDRIALKLTQIA